MKAVRYIDSTYTQCKKKLVDFSTSIDFFHISHILTTKCQNLFTNSIYTNFLQTILSYPARFLPTYSQSSVVGSQLRKSFWVDDHLAVLWTHMVCALILLHYTILICSNGHFSLGPVVALQILICIIYAERAEIYMKLLGSAHIVVVFLCLRFR